MFHAADDHGSIRAEVLGVLGAASFRVDATLFDKHLVPPDLRDQHALYAFAWHQHLSRVAPAIAGPGDRLLVVASELGTKRRRRAFFEAVQSAVDLTTCAKRRAAFWPNASDPCLWAADYACWAIHRAHEHGDDGPKSALGATVRTAVRFWHVPENEETPPS